MAVEKEVFRHRMALVVALAWLVFIWSNSLQTAAESSQVSRGVLSWVVPFLTHSGIPEWLWHTLIRKLAHMTEFAAAGILWFVALWPQKKKTPCVYRKRGGAALLVCAAAAVLDESIQRFVPGRSGELRDVCLDILGAMLGILAAAMAAWIWERRSVRANV